MKKKNLIITAIGIMILITGGYFFWSHDQAVEADMIVTERFDLEKYVEDTGIVALSEQQLVYASVSGTVSELYYEVGQQVSQRERLIEINSDDLRMMVARSQTLAADRAVAEKNLLENQKQLENMELLKEAGAVSLRDYQAFYLTVQAEKNRLDTIAREQRLLDQQLADAQTRILAPISGVIMQSHINKGDFIVAGTPLFMVGDPVSLYLESDILVSDINQIAIGNPVIISNKNAGIEELQGIVTKIHPKAFSKLSDLGVEQKRVTVRIDFKEGQSSLANLRSGYEMDVKIVVEQREQVISIPSNAVFQIQNQDHVFVVQNGRSYLRQVQTGIESQRRVEIKAGLEEGETVIILPPSGLSDGGRVQQR